MNNKRLEQENLRMKRALMRQQINQSHRLDRLQEESEIEYRFHSNSLFVKREELSDTRSTTSQNEQQSWERLDKFDQMMPSTRNSCSWVLFEESLYIFGGFTFNGRLDDVFQYSFQLNQWHKIQTKGQKPSPRENNGAVQYKGSLYVFGGYDGQFWLNDFYQLNLINQVWSKIEQKGQCPSERYGFACGVFQNKMLIFGGISGSNQYNDAFIWDFDKCTWNKLNLSGDIPSQRSCHSFSTMNNYIYIFGGFDEINRLNDFYKINFLSGKVKRISQHGSIPCPRYFHASEIYNNKLFLFGGFNGHVRLNDLYEFDFAQKNWTKLEMADPPQGRSSMVFQLYNDSLYIFGGYNGLDLLNDMYRMPFRNAKVPRSSFLNDMKSLINNPLMSDVVFLVENQQIYANKCILGARSQHFQTLFFEEFSDKEQDYIEVHDCNYSTFMDLMQFMYTDQLDQSFSINRLLQLLIISDHYLMQRLKYLCEEQLIIKVTSNNVIDLLLFGKRYNCKLLRNHSMKVLVDNISTIKRTKDFGKLAQEPDILIEIIQKKC